jgi:hypothetical protein
MTTTRIYRSTDSGAPVLSGQVGSLHALLKACLVGTSGVAYGTGPNEKAAAGWSIAFEDVGNNKIALQNSVAEGGTGMVLRVDDNGSGSAGAREALCAVYSSMSDIDTGADRTPAAAVVSVGSVWRKSNTLNGTARAWTLNADELTCYLCVHDDGAGTPGTYAAGDFDSEVPADPWRFFISGRGASSGANPTDAGSLFLGCSNAYVAAATSTFWLARNLSGSSGTGPIRAALCRLANVGDGVVAAIGGSTNNLVASSPGGAAEYWYPALIGCENTIRGRLRGVYIPANRLDGVAAGLDREDAVGLPANSRLTIVRHNTTWGGFFAQYDGHLGVESRLGW